MERALRETWPSKPRQCLAYAAFAVLLTWSWQAATVHFNYGGNWTALFCTGSAQPVPPELVAGTYRVQDPGGYDGQYYRYMAHDPESSRSWSKYFDNPTYRYRAILVPVLAWLFAGGQFGYIDAAYIVVGLLAVFGGVYWLSLYACSFGRRAAWGLTFLLVPATVVSVNRLTVDVALMALCAGFAWYARRQASGRQYAVALAAGLVRETGLFLAVASCFDRLWKRDWRGAALFGTATLPTLAWYRFLTDSASHATEATAAGRNLIPIWLFRRPVIGIFMRLLHPVRYSLDPTRERLAEAFNSAALFGILLAAALGVYCLWRWRLELEQWVIALFIGLFAAVTIPSFWFDVNGYSRPLSGLLFFVALRALRGGSWIFAAPIVLVDLCLCVQLNQQILGVLRGLVHSVARV